VAKKKTKLGWNAALKLAENIISEGNLTRSQHLGIFKKMLYSQNSQDRRIAIGLLKLFIKLNPRDFDRDVKLEDLVAYGNLLSNPHWKDFGRQILFEVLKLREVTAVWIDDIADEQSKNLRLAFATALDQLAARKRIDESRTLGMAKFFLDQPEIEVREEIVKALSKIAGRDPQKLHYFLKEHENGAGSYRLALIAQTRQALGWK